MTTSEHENYKISLILEENDLDKYVIEEILEWKEEESESTHKKNMIRDKRIIFDSIKYHLIPHVSSLKTPKNMFDSLTKLHEGNNINHNMTLRNQLKNVNIQDSKSFQLYFLRVSQIKEQLEAIEENVEEGEIVMTTLNGLLKSWDSFIQGICARNKLIKSIRLWEECTQ